MAYDVIHKNSTVAGTPPSAGEIEVGEIAINAADASLYVKDTAGTVQEFKSKFTQTSTGATLRTVDSKLKDTINAKDFGAVSDGITDNAAQVGNAAATATTVEFSTGTYKLDSSIDIGLSSFELNANALFTGSGAASPSGVNYTEEIKYGKRFSNTSIEPYSIYGDIYPNVSAYDALQAVAQLPPGSSLVSHMSAISGYFQADAASAGIGNNIVGLFSCGKATVNDAAIWGLNTLLQDSATREAGTATGIKLLGAELDFNVMNPGTDVIGVSIGGNSLAQPAVATGYICNTLGNGNKWTTAFASLDGCATNGIGLGALETSGTSVKSQSILFSYFDGSGTKGSVVLGANASGDLEILTPSGTSGLTIGNGNLALPGNHALQIAGVNSVFGDINGNLTFGNSSKITSIQGFYTVVDTLFRFQYFGFGGSGSAALGANCPAVTPSTPFAWITAQTSDGSTVYIPCWK